jgi:hypothetical protein
MRHWFLYLLVVLLIFTGCSKPAPVSDDIAEVDDAPAESARLVSAVLEYGEPDGIIDNEGPVFSYLLFPKTGTAAVDLEISGWATRIYMDAKKDVAELIKTDADADAEITVQYNAYLLEDSYAGIEETGSMIHSGMANAQEIVKAFNIDVENGLLISNEEILDVSRTDEVLGLLADKLAADDPDDADAFEELDASALDHFVLTHEGIRFLLPRASVLPAYLGSLKATLSYEELGDLYILSAGGTTSPPQSSGEDDEEEDGDDTAAPPSDIDPDKPMVALTFDDGPSKVTSRILKLLRDNDSRATFCTVGNRVEEFSDTVQQANDQGCQVIGLRGITRISPN